jgi:hypothetical protein
MAFFPAAPTLALPAQERGRFARRKRMAFRVRVTDFMSKLLGLDHVPFGHDRGRDDQMFEFPDISWPGIGHKNLERSA